MSLRDKLKEFCREYFSKEENFLKKEFSRLADGKDKPLAELKEAEEKIKKIKEEFSKNEKPSAAAPEISKMESRLEELRLKRFSSERELGRIEGMIELQESRQKEAGKELIERSPVEKFIEKLNQHLKEGFVKSTFEKIEKAVSEFSEQIKMRRQDSLDSELADLNKKRNDLSL